MPTSSAPGKVYLFGEHAVVYGEPAVPCAIERRVRARVAGRNDGRVVVRAPDLPLEAAEYEYRVSALAEEPEPVARTLRYVDGALTSARDLVGVDGVGFDVTVESALPIGAGLGSSAAVTVAVLDAAARALGAPLDAAALADRAYQVELQAQDGQASRADTFCAATGGAVRVEGDDCRSIETPSLPFVIGYDGGSGDTGELVSGVRRLTEDYEFAARTVQLIGELVRQGEAVLANEEIDELGRLMDVNHGLLAALGVSGPTIEAMVWTARDAGAVGAKLTGAGGAGCVVALDESPATERALADTSVCESAFRAALDTEGVRHE